ncbi:TlpA disulfide reductase family protein [Mucilaginibacter sp.]|uniref:TlpA family protein disulfide reductase n=1 Tax=Mucilaginibacter sp. TaxID=1882438 RepID=UPI00262FAF2D|nr:TlpA disulfide reductase family protein [Mucilaginibacter sp.]MDB5030570.1 hypothetical protein [Mucilaginibacter sp.]
MTYTIRMLIKAAICIAFFLYNTDVKAQTSLVQNVIDKLESYKNFSYQYIYKQKDFTSDTLIKKGKDIFLKTPEDKFIGYLFRRETSDTEGKNYDINLYNGQNLINLTPQDSTYQIKKTLSGAIGGSLFFYLKLMKSKTNEKRPVINGGDTIINALTCTHIITTIYDTVISKEHYYTRVHLFVNKQTGLPKSIISQSRNNFVGNGITNSYTENSYSDYKLDQADIGIATFTVPKGFHLPKPQTTPPLALLTSGTVAPDWTMYSADGKKVSLTQLKGKVVLLDFYFIGCLPCMDAIKPLNKLYEKYKSKDIVIASVTDRDSKKTVLAFEKQYGIKYPGYVDAAGVVKSYHVDSFPTFYLIDKEGKIANTFIGYSDDFEAKTTTIIDTLLNK